MTIIKATLLAAAGTLVASGALAATFTIEYRADPDAPFNGGSFHPGFAVDVEAEETAEAGLFEVTDVLSLAGSSYTSTGHFGPGTVFNTGAPAPASFRSDGSLLDLGFCFNNSGLADACEQLSELFRLTFGAPVNAYYGDAYRRDPFSVGFFGQTFDPDGLTITRTDGGGGMGGGSGGGTGGGGMSGGGTGGGGTGGGTGGGGGGTGSPTVVPLPASAWLLVAGFGALGALRRRKSV